MLFVMSGPSGVGKSTLVRKVAELNPSLHLPVSFTTRTPKNGEKNGVHYHFVSCEIFQRLMDRGQFAECAIVHGHHYGTLKFDLYSVSTPESDRHDVLLEIDVQGMRNIKRQFPGAITIFVLPTSFAILEARIRECDRGDTEEEMSVRLENARTEIDCADEFDYRVVNGNLDVAIRAVLEIFSHSKTMT